jgi:hypothetical protein
MTNNDLHALFIGGSGLFTYHDEITVAIDEGAEANG